MVAASTGPLHIAAALNKYAIGLFVPLRPMHPGRWEPIGDHAKAITGRTSCEGCPGSNDCACMQSIEVESVVRILKERD
jgi:ADP-heptose:LPS heptosyltransferase